MARLSSRPPYGVVTAGKGKVDFAAWRGLYYARAWPKKPTGPRSTKVQQQMARMTAAAKVVRQLSAADYNFAYAATKGTQWTYRDYLFSQVYGKSISWKTNYHSSPTAAPGGVVSMVSTACATYPTIALKKAIQGSVRVALSAVKPTSRHIVKKVLGEFRNCGTDFVVDNAEELNLIDAGDGITELLGLPELASGAFIWWWIFGTEAGLVKSWVSAIHIAHNCTPEAGFGTCQVHASGTQLSIGTGAYQQPTLNQIVEDPGGWTGFGGTTIRPPDQGVYTIIALATADSFNGSSGTLTSGLQVSGGVPTQIFDEQSDGWSPTKTATIVHATTYEANAPLPSFAMLTKATSGQLYFGGAQQRLVVSR